MSDWVKDLGELLDSQNMQVTFTGWKAELEKAEKRIEELEYFKEEALKDIREDEVKISMLEKENAKMRQCLENLAETRGIRSEVSDEHGWKHAMAQAARECLTSLKDDCLAPSLTQNETGALE